MEKFTPEQKRQFNGKWAKLDIVDANKNEEEKYNEVVDLTTENEILARKFTSQLEGSITFNELKRSIFLKSCIKEKNWQN